MLNSPTASILRSLISWWPREKTPAVRVNLMIALSHTERLWRSIGASLCKVATSPGLKSREPLSRTVSLSFGGFGRNCRKRRGMGPICPVCAAHFAVVMALLRLALTGFNTLGLPASLQPAPTEHFYLVRTGLLRLALTASRQQEPTASRRPAPMDLLTSGLAE